MSFKGKVAVVTGGSSGIGKAVVELLASEGAAVAINDVDCERAESLCAEINSAGGQALALPGDASDPAVATDGMLAVLEVFGQVDILVNNAGIAHNAPAIDYQIWDRMLAVDLSGPFHWARAAAVHSMIPSGRGAIINVASLAGLRGYSSSVGYIAAKSGLVGLTRALAVEWGVHGIRVNCVCPGITLTRTLKNIEAGAPGKFNEKMSSIPLGRMIHPIEQARVIAFLASDAASAMSGAIIPVDGGHSAVLPGEVLTPPSHPLPFLPFEPSYRDA